MRLFYRMKSIIRPLLYGLAALSFGTPAVASDYAEGQVWEYQTRPGDEGSLVIIQQIEPAPPDNSIDTIYHVSLVGLNISVNGRATNEVAHLPVSRQTLDASVTVLSDERPTTIVPVEQGIAEWRAADGGVFTIPLNEIAEVVVSSLAGQPD